MKYCSHCGAELVDEAVVCPKCGCAVAPLAVDRSNSWNVLCIVGFVCSFFMAIVGLVCSIIGRKQAMQSGEKGKELATAGLVISIVNLCIVGFVVMAYIVFAGLIWVGILSNGM